MTNQKKTIEPEMNPSNIETSEIEAESHMVSVYIPRKRMMAYELEEDANGNAIKVLPVWHQGKKYTYPIGKTLEIPAEIAELLQGYVQSLAS